MKKLFFLLITIVFSTMGCKGPDHRLEQWMSENGKVKVLSTTVQIGEFVTAVGGERIDSQVLITGDLNPHTYELVKGDGEKIERAHLIVCNGLGLEHGASLAALLQKSPKAFAMGDRIASEFPDLILKQREIVDPHIWMDVSLWSKGIDPIVERLSTLDPEGASYFAARADALKREVEKVDREILAHMQEIPAEKRYLVTSHDAFHYFTRRYLAIPGELHWEERFAAPEGLAPDGQLNPVDLRKVVEFLAQRQVTVIFPESNVNRDAIQKIAFAGKELGLEIRICSEPLYGDSTSGLSYLESMRKNGEVLSKHLK